MAVRGACVCVRVRVRACVRARAAVCAWARLLLFSARRQGAGERQTCHTFAETVFYNPPIGRYIKLLPRPICKRPCTHPDRLTSSSRLATAPVAAGRSSSEVRARRRVADRPWPQGGTRQARSPLSGGPAGPSGCLSARRSRCSHGLSPRRARRQSGATRRLAPNRIPPDSLCPPLKGTIRARLQRAERLAEAAVAAVAQRCSAADARMAAPRVLPADLTALVFGGGGGVLQV
jgi:hypothetical protein